jgi:hypothetical protein
VSILTRLTGRHLDDAAFAELWTNATAEGHGSLGGDPHLATCAECRVRFASFRAWMDELRADAVEEADIAFGPERLAAQHAHILRRLHAIDEPTRIIAFPGAAAGRVRPSPIRRWVTGAAAAGLIVGVGLGQLMDLRRFSEPTRPVADRRLEAPRSSGLPGVVPVAAFNEEAALAELEDAAIPRYDALRAYDTFTPRAADYIQPR